MTFIQLNTAPLGPGSYTQWLLPIGSATLAQDLFTQRRRQAKAKKIVLFGENNWMR
ncbi:hypothetical protein KJI95_09285 [Shewanella sp. JM162201]|uniref:Uncharacterized protein n=1 Tax=Shewanella jiangmenensis TaxID=2837387 RepID=A0ABS5V2N8_9GAMM|nr:hypothetical protein [Shewanella jiangmenensis]MBT1444712.1 hypothetical protein [Shewanella jiangmenensis]